MDERKETIVKAVLELLIRRHESSGMSSSINWIEASSYLRNTYPSLETKPTEIISALDYLHNDMKLVSKEASAHRAVPYRYKLRKDMI